MSIRIKFRIRFLIDFGTDFGSILGAKTASVSCAGDPPFGAGAVGAQKNDTKGFHPSFYPLRHRFWSNFRWILVDFSFKKLDIRAVLRPNRVCTNPVQLFNQTSHAEENQQADNQPALDKPCSVVHSDQSRTSKPSSRQPTNPPTHPTNQPTNQTTNQPTNQPTDRPINQPTNQSTS